MFSNFNALKARHRRRRSKGGLLKKAAHQGRPMADYTVNTQKSTVLVLPKTGEIIQNNSVQYVQLYMKRCRPN